MGRREILKCWIIRGGEWVEKNLSINGWVRHNGGVDLKRGVIHSKVVLVPQKVLNKTSTFWPNAPKILSKCIPDWHKIHFLLHFYACSFSNNRYEWIIFLCGIYILSFKFVKNWSNWSKALLSFFVFIRFELQTIIKIWSIVSL